MKGLITRKDRLKDPVRKANMVPSMFNGVIFAKNERTGIMKRDVAIYPMTPSMQNMNQKFGIPN